MITAIYIEMNVFALVILFVVFVNNKNRVYGYLFEQKLFLLLLALNALQLIISIIYALMNGSSGLVLREINYIFSNIGFILTFFIFVVWSLYVRYQVYRDEKKAKSMIIPFLVPACINVILAVLSRFFGFYFYFDETNVYHRGKLFFIYAVTCVAYIIYNQIVIIIKQKQIIKKYYSPLFLFAIPPFIGGILQILFYGINLVWVGMTVSVLVIFVDIQNDRLFTDQLTGLYNRRQLDCYLKNRVKKNNKGNLLAGAMIDLDFFKNVNDTWGHSVGDQMLIDTGEILKRSFEKNDLVCRYGGDEFVVIFEIKNKSELIEVINRIKTNICIYQGNNHTPYEINLSIGYDIYDYNSGFTVQQFLDHIDNLMYENKKYNKILK